MRVWITKKPVGTVLGVNLCHYREGGIYEVDASLGDYLVVEGYANVEMRMAQRSRRFRANDRRRPPHRPRGS